MTGDRKIAVVGLGYVGLPVAVSFARSGRHVTGYDVDPTRVAELIKGHDRTHEVEPCDLRQDSLVLTTDAGLLRACDFYVVTVPTPIDNAVTAASIMVFVVFMVMSVRRRGRAALTVHPS